MERPVGDKFKINGCVYVVIEDTYCDWYGSCGECAFPSGCCSDIIGVRGECMQDARKDMKSVHFEHFGVDF